MSYKAGSCRGTVKNLIKTSFNLFMQGRARIHRSPTENSAPDFSTI